VTPPPFYGADRPEDIRWITAADGKRLRAGHWPKGQKGTILLFTGRTEFLEKYTDAAQTFAALGWGMASLDWRGQGLSARLLEDPQIGHVGDFSEYQRDVDAFVDYCTRCDLPKPWVMFAHSMGGAIGLRALHNGFRPAAAVFSAPMWDIQLRPVLRILAKLAYFIAKPIGLAARYAPTQGPHEPMVFEGNPLTHDPARLDWMKEQAKADPLLTLGGPSISWVYHALAECQALAALPAPKGVPTLGFVGTDERVVSRERIAEIMATWPDGQFLEIEGAAHEVLMETDPLRDQALRAIAQILGRVAP
jgi:lysophospholipase